jgi:Domain of unknown function (DUF4184)
MPFTLAHPAAAVPLARLLGGWGMMSALIIGSMTPDIAFLLPIGVSRSQSHSLPGLFWCSLPVGLCCYLVFHVVMKRPMIHLLPPLAFTRLARYAISDWALRWRSVLPVMASLLIGSFTHVLWDSFTHKGSWAVRNFAWLRIHLFTGGGFWIYLYTALQWISSFVGLGLLAWWTMRWLRATPVPTQSIAGPIQRERRWLTMLLIAITSVAMGALAVRPYIVPAVIASTQELVSRTMLGAISGFGAALLVYCAIWNVWTWRHP